MRKTTQRIAEAFKNGKKLTLGNTNTDGQTVCLHGNAIMRKTENGLYVTLAGWNTNTTRERINGILHVLGKDSFFSQRNFIPYYNKTRCKIDEWLPVQ